MTSVVGSLTHDKQLGAGALDAGAVDGAADVLVRILAEHVHDGQEVVVALAPDAVARTVGYLTSACGYKYVNVKVLLEYIIVVHITSQHF